VSKHTLSSVRYAIKGHEFNVANLGLINWVVADNRKFKTAFTNAVLFAGEGCMENVQFRALTRDAKLLRMSAGPDGAVWVEADWSDGATTTCRIGTDEGDRRVQVEGRQFVPIRGFIDDIASSERRAYRFLTKAALSGMSDAEIHARMTPNDAAVYADYAFRVDAPNALVRVAEVRDLVNKDKLAASRKAKAAEDAIALLRKAGPTPTDEQMADAKRALSTMAAQLRHDGVDDLDWAASVQVDVEAWTRTVERLEPLVAALDDEDPEVDEIEEEEEDDEVDMDVLEAYATFAELQHGETTCLWCGVEHGKKWSKRRVKTALADLEAAYEAQEGVDDLEDEDAPDGSENVVQAYKFAHTCLAVAPKLTRYQEAARVVAEYQRRLEAAERVKPLQVEQGEAANKATTLKALLGTLDALEAEIGKTAAETFVQKANKHLGDYELVIAHDPLAFFLRDTRTNEVITDPSGSQQVWMLIAMIIAAHDPASEEGLVLVAPDRGWDGDHAAEMTRALGKKCPVQVFIPSTVAPKGRTAAHVRVITEAELAPVDAQAADETPEDAVEAPEVKAPAQASTLPFYPPPEKAPHWLHHLRVAREDSDIKDIEAWWASNGLPAPGPRRILHHAKHKDGLTLYHCWDFNEAQHAHLPYKSVVLFGRLSSPTRKVVLVRLREE